MALERKIERVDEVARIMIVNLSTRPYVLIDGGHSTAHFPYRPGSFGHKLSLKCLLSVQSLYQERKSYADFRSLNISRPTSLETAFANLVLPAARRSGGCHSRQIATDNVAALTGGT